MARPIQPTHTNALTARPARRGDGLALASRLRASDALEMRAAGRLNAADDLELACSPVFLTITGADENDEPVLMFGADREVRFQSWGPSVAIWMLAAKGVENHARQIARLSRPYVKALLNAVGRSVAGHNIVDARNTLHLRWLTWCGAVFTGNAYCPTDPNIPFLEFYIPNVSPCPGSPACGV